MEIGLLNQSTCPGVGVENPWFRWKTGWRDSEEKMHHEVKSRNGDAYRPMGSQER